MEQSCMTNCVKIEPCIVIGISGPSASGKTTLAHQLQKTLLRSTIISLDYYLQHKHVTIFEHPKNSEIKYQNWETPQCVNFKLLQKHILETKESGKFSYLIVEGFLLFADSSLIPCLDLMIFLDHQNWSELAKRRVERSYGFTMDMYEYLVWPFYLQNKPLQISNVVNYLQQIQQTSKFLQLQSDSMESEQIYQLVRQFINKQLECL